MKTGSERQPVLFLGHGSPMNAIEDNHWRRNWQALGAEFGTRWPRPSLILSISSHWLTEGSWLTAMEQPRTIHDFGGFPQALFDEQYPAPGAPARAAAIAREIGAPAIGLDQQWGLDHGTWSVLKPMFPAADIPVIQLSMDYSRPAAEHFALGAQLRKLRDDGVLIVGSGNCVHNLRAAKWGVPDTEAYDWAVAFDDHVRDRIEGGELQKLADFQSLGNIARLAHPTHEHYLPLLYAAGAAHPGEPVRFFNEGYQLGSIAMRSVVWG
jgi:4,5-DOPA dioxygenase extradiol